jgi:HK97 family phage major capsid protein
MDRIKELEAERDERRGTIREILDGAAKDKRALTDEERTQTDAATVELDRIRATLSLEQVRANFDRKDAPAIDAAPAAKPIPAAALAEKTPESKRNWTGFGKFLGAVADFARTGRIDTEVLAGPTGVNVTTPSEGGFLVQRQYSDALLARAIETSKVASRAWWVPVGDGFDGVEMPYIEETSRVTGSRWGGVQVYRRAEAETVTASKPKLGRFDLRLEDLMGICYATERSIRDASALGAIISKAFASEMAFKLDDEVIRGTGVGQSQGILASPCRVTVAKEAGQTAATIVAKNVMNMRSRMRPPSRGNYVWLYNQDIEPQLHSMSVPVGVAGVPVYSPANGLAGPYDTLYGRPLVPIEQADTLGQEGDIIAADMAEYMIIDKGGIETAESMHVRFLYGENVFRFLWRVNGAPTWKLALTPYKGSATVSPFVTLAVRA